MADTTLQGSMVKWMTADSGSASGKQFAAVCFVSGTEDNFTMPGAANAGRFAGFVQQDFVAGDQVAVHMHGGISRCIAAGAISQGDYLQIADTSGRVQTASQPQQNQVDAGLTIASNAATLTKPAAGLAAILVTAGTVSGAFTQIPRGVAPTVTKTCSLSADGTKVNFLAADAVTTVTVEYALQQPVVAELCGRAVAVATALNDIIAAVPIYGTRQG